MITFTQCLLAIHGVDFIFIARTYFLAHGFERRCQHTVVDTEEFVNKREFLEPLKTVELVLLGDLVEGRLDFINKGLLLDNFFNRLTSHVVRRGPCLYVILIDSDNSHNVVAHSVTIDVYLLYIWRSGIEVLQLLGSNVFTLAQLEQVAGTVKDPEPHGGHQLNDVTGAVPSLGVQHFSGFLWASEIPQHETTTLDKELTTWWVATGIVFHFGDRT
ncbi:RTX toxin, putative [Babesia ovis]|uniref:RTX toxin, putative n=1 Tax=Babesia ovis TaxID=5869 RepID=A0A9W5TDZ2_BABOV|nr:RTX toxin, putative [Babesia ovis]